MLFKSKELVLEEFKLKAFPRQIGELLPTLGTGKGLIITAVEIEAVQPFISVTVRLYVPEDEIVGLLTIGSKMLEENPFGPSHKKVLFNPGVVLEADKFKVVPVQTGELLPAVGIGNAKTVTSVEAVEIHPFTSVMITEYIPDLEVLEFRIDGSFRLDVKPSGPDQEKLFPFGILVFDAVRSKESPVQIGVLLEADPLGNILIATALVAEAEQPFTSVTITE